MPDALTVHLVAGQEALERDDRAGAVTAFTAARDLAPAEPSVAIMLANAHRLAGDTVSAREALLRAHRDAVWSEASVGHALGAALLEAGAPAEAAACFARVVSARPRDGAALSALAGAMRTAGDPAGAWPIMHRALAVSPDAPAVLVTAAQVRHDLGDLRGALRFLDRADAARPGHAPTQLQRAYIMLMAGIGSDAWAAFESRPRPSPASDAREWDGHASIAGASMLVTAEQGIGDQFQFLRFLGALAARGPSRVVVECHADVVSLLQANGIEAIARGGAHGELPVTDWHVPLLSLPHRLGLHDDMMAGAVPYLHASSRLPESRPTGSLRLGLVWAGNPAFLGRVTRDLDTALLPEIASMAGVEWISLQHGPAGEARLQNVTRVAPRDWMETADILAGLDGLVSTDTGIVHLAGAMGVRTWTMLQAVPDWRWGMQGSTSAWYPTMTLLRPDTPGNWRSVVERLRQSLHEFAAARGAGR